jgi:hypothetical protein
MRTWWWKTRDGERARKDRAIRCAIRKFRASRGFAPLGGHVLHIDDGRAIVRVMYATNRIPPDRAWFAVPATGAAVRELAFEDIAYLETAWR